MVNVNCCKKLSGRIWKTSVQSKMMLYWEVGKHLCSGLICHVLGHISRQSLINGRLTLIPVFYDRKRQPASLLMALILAYLEGMPSHATLKEEKKSYGVHGGMFISRMGLSALRWRRCQPVRNCVVIFEFDPDDWYLPQGYLALQKCQ